MQAYRIVGREDKDCGGKVNPSSFLPFMKGEVENSSLPLIKGGIEGGFNYD